MDLEDITLDGVKHGHVEDLKTGKTSDIFTKAMNNKGIDKKHMTMLKHEGTTLGYVYYTSNEKKSESSFMGVEVIKDNRDMSLSNALFEIYFRICEENNVEILKTKNQRKPFTIYLLKKWGYEYHRDVSHIDILPKTNNKLRIRFNNDEQRNRFMNTRLYRSGQYEIVQNSVEEAIETVILNRGYSLTNKDRHLQKRQEVQERFNVHLN
jgi:hypothetical protein